MEPLLDAALEGSPEERDALVQHVHDTDPQLHAELQSLLRDAERVSELPLFDTSASGMFSSLLRENTEALVSALEIALAERYTIERQIGAGGMAAVYLAHDIRLHRKVAIKVLNPDLSHTLGAERFAREIRLVAALEHPNIVGVLDSGDADGHLWFAMPFIDGESLRDRITRAGPLPLEDALSIMQQTASAWIFTRCARCCTRCSLAPRRSLARVRRPSSCAP